MQPDITDITDVISKWTVCGIRWKKIFPSKKNAWQSSSPPSHPHLFLSTFFSMSLATSIPLFSLASFTFSVSPFAPKSFLSRHQDKAPLPRLEAFNNHFPLFKSIHHYFALLQYSRLKSALLWPCSCIPFSFCVSILFFFFHTLMCIICYNLNNKKVKLK